MASNKVFDKTDNVFEYINEFLTIPDLEILLDKICKEAPQIINGKECSIFLKQDYVIGFNNILENGDGTLINSEELSDKEYVVLARTTRPDFKNRIGRAYYCKGIGLTGWIFQNKKDLQIGNMHDPEELSRIDINLKWEDAYHGSTVHFGGKEKKPFLGVPLLKENAIFGVIRIAEPMEGDSFKPGSKEILTSFAKILTNAILKVTTERNLKESIKTLIRLGAMRNKVEIYQAIVNEAKLLVGAMNCELYFLDREGEKITLRETTGGYMEELKNGKKDKPYKRGDGLTGWIFKTGKPLLIQNILNFKEEHELSDKDLEIYSDGPYINDERDRMIKWSDQDGQYEKHVVPHPYFLGVPIKSEHREVMGVLRVSSPKTKIFFEKLDMQLLQKFADYISIIFQNERQTKLYNVLIEIGNIFEKQELFNYVVSKIPDLVLSKGCSVFIVEPEPDYKFRASLKFSSSHLLIDTDGKVINLKYKRGQGKTGFVAKVKRPLLINYYGTGKIKTVHMEEDFSVYSTKIHDNLVHYINDKNGKQVGIARLFRRDGDPAFTEGDRNSFRDFCGQNIYEEGGLPSNEHVKCETGAGGYAQSFLAVPIKLKTDLLGVLRIPRTAEGGRFSDGDLELVESIAGRLATVLEVQENLKEKLEILCDINSKINSPFDKDKILDEILRSITEKLGFEFATIQLVDKEKQNITTARGMKNPSIEDAIDPNLWRGLSHPLFPPAGGKRDIHAYVLMKLRHEVVIKGWDDHFHEETYYKYKHGDLIRAFVPIIVCEPKTGKRIEIGTVEAGHNIKRKNFIDDQEIFMLKAVANQVAITIWNREQVWTKLIIRACHEARNHFTTMKIILEKLNEGDYGELNTEQVEKVRTAIIAARTQQNLLTKLLEISRIAKEMTSLIKTGFSNFYEEQFGEGYTVEKLCKTIAVDIPDINVTSPHNSVYGLNKLLGVNDLYEKLESKNIRPNRIQSECVSKLRQVYIETRRIDDLKRLNRCLLESFFSDVCPKSPKSKISLNTIINEVCRLFKHSMSEKGINLYTVFHNKSILIDMDVDKVKEIISNLIENAIKFVKDSKGEITISTKDDGKNLTVSVKDNGIGIPEYARELIFQEFFQVDNSAGGTGVGLNIAKTYVELHGGKIEVIESEVGKGSTFGFTIPMG